MPIGSFINAFTVLLGSTIGLLLREKFPENIKAIIFQGLGLVTLVLGMQMALQAENFLVFIFSLILGAVIGELIKLEARMETLSEWFKSKIQVQNARFTEGLITAFLIFCVGSMTFVGAINEGLGAGRTLILTKSILDGFTSIVLASVYGVGVLFSILPLFLIQAGLTLFAAQFQSFFSPVLIAQLTAVGGVLIIGIGINLLEIQKIKTTNFLPGLLVVVVLTVILG